jgi:hypothetical protein
MQQESQRTIDMSSSKSAKRSASAHAGGASAQDDSGTKDTCVFAVIPPNGKCNIQSLKPGDFLSRINYIKIVSNDGSNVTVQDETGFQWNIAKTILENQATNLLGLQLLCFFSLILLCRQAYTSNQFTKVENVTRTEMAALLETEVRDQVFSCCFNKLPNSDEQSSILENADVSTAAKRKRVAKELVVGPERIMHAYLTDTHELGRMPVFDLEAKGRAWLIFARSSGFVSRM